MFSLWVSTQFITEALGAIDLEDQHSVQLGWNIVSLVEVVRCAVVVVGGQLQVRWWKGVFVDRWINSAASGDIPHCRLAHCRQSVQLQLVKFSLQFSARRRLNHDACGGAVRSRGFRFRRFLRLQGKSIIAYDFLVLQTSKKCKPLQLYLDW